MLMPRMVLSTRHVNKDALSLLKAAFPSLLDERAFDCVPEERDPGH